MKLYLYFLHRSFSVSEHLCLLLLDDADKVKYLNISEPISQFQSIEDYWCIQETFKHLMNDHYQKSLAQDNTTLALIDSWFSSRENHRVNQTFTDFIHFMCQSQKNCDGKEKNIHVNLITLLLRRISAWFYNGSESFSQLT